MPSRVQSFWFGPELNALQVLSIRSFLAHGHDFHLYSFDQIRNVPAGVTAIDASTILPRDAVFTYQRGFGKGSVSAFSNQFRYKLLLEKGGWWVDTDVVCLRPFEFDAEYVFASERDVRGAVSAATCVVRCPSGSDLLKYCVEECERVDKAALEWGEIGPRLMQRAISRFTLDQFCVPPEIFNPVDYSAFRDLVAPAFDISTLSGSSAVHLWGQKWVSHYMDPEYPGEPGSLYAQLRTRYLDPQGQSIDRAELLLKHSAYQDCVIDALRVERDEAQYALESEAQRLTSSENELLVTRKARLDAEAQLTTARHELSAMGMELATARRELHDARTALSGAENEIRAMRAELQTERTSLAAARGEVNAIRSSLSWRFTKPLRWLYDQIVNMGRRLRG